MNVIRYCMIGLLTGLITVLSWSVITPPGQAHWADMSAAEIIVNDKTVDITLTFPTGLTAFADDDQNGQLSRQEVQNHRQALQSFLGQAIQLTNQQRQAGALTIAPLEKTASPALRAAPTTHSMLQLTYVWPQPIQGLKIDYHLFLPGVSTASCLATILQHHQLQTFVFTPTRPMLALTPGLNSPNRNLLLALLGATAWGAMHALSPGHGKTLVGAYLVGARATAQHAVFLALTTTVTHTLGIFALGFLTLIAAQWFMPEQLYPWLNLLSGMLVIAVGVHLLRQRWQKQRGYHFHGHHHEHEHYHDHHHHHHHDHDHHRHHHHDHHPNHNQQTHNVDLIDIHHRPDHSNHTHINHTHSHLPVNADGSPVTWRNLLALGISGGLIPCPAALVLLLSAIALGNVQLGLVLVLAFSLGLAAVLTGLGLLIVYARTLFQYLPVTKRRTSWLPVLSALGIVIIGCGLSSQALMQLVG